MKNTRIPSHVGVIPGGQKRWADNRGLPFAQSLAEAVKPAAELLKACRKAGVEQLTILGSKAAPASPGEDPQAAVKAWLAAVETLRSAGAAVLVVGDDKGKDFPAALRKHLKRSGSGLKVNLLLNYGADWDLEGLKGGSLRSGEIPDVDLVLRWGGRHALGGFLPVQSREADLMVIDELWPDFHADHLEQAVSWFRSQRRQ